MTAAVPLTVVDKKKPTKAMHTAKKVIQDVFVKSIRPVPSTLSALHIQALMDEYQQPNDFANKLQDAKVEYFRRFSEKDPRLDTGFLLIIVKSIEML